MKKGSDFGNIKPLPGQAGYKVSITEQLDREAREMEERLKILQERMKQQSIEDADATKNGTRWKSSNPERGSIRAYAKDVQEKHQKKKAEKPDATLKATASARRQVRQNNSEGGFNVKNVEMWSVNDVGDWLKSMMLNQYVDIFTQNQITGPILLELSLQDLDYMEITILGHRKVLLKGIEDLRQNKKVTKPLFASAGDDSKSNKQRNENPAIVAEAKDPNPVGVVKKHWSVIPPLSTNHVKNDPQYLAPNSADYHHVSEYEAAEEEEKKAFQEAVLEWRKSSASGGKVQIVYESEQAKRSKSGNIAGTGTSSTTSSAVYNNDNCLLDEEAERKAFQEAVAAWRSGKSEEESTTNSSNLWSNPFSDDVNDGDPAGIAVDDESSPPAQRGGNKVNLLEGFLDEEKEHKEFQAAVEAWRHGKTSARGNSSQLAEQIAREMDAKHQEAAQQLNAQQLNLKQLQLQKEQELENLRAKLKEKESIFSQELPNEDEEIDGDTINGNEDYAAYTYKEDALSECSDFDEKENDPVVSKVEVMLLESTMNDPHNANFEQLAQENANYEVCEPSDDEDNE